MENIRFVSIKEYARIFGLAENSVRRMCRDGAISCQKCGGRWRLAIEEPKRDEPESKPPDISGAILKWLDAVDQATRALRLEIQEATNDSTA